MEWTYIVRNRQRWRSLKESAARQDERARTFLTNDLKISEDTLEHIANEGAVEVVIPYDSESDGWEQRILPWEFVLSAATRSRRRGPLTITRQLVTRHAPQPSPMSSLKVLYVECAPGSLRDEYTFVSERLLVESNLLPGETKPPRLETPTLAQLTQQVIDTKPDIIHLAGFDTHQGLQALGRDQSDVPDGYLMIDGKGAPLAVSAQDLSGALTAANHRPRLVSFAINNSGARSAALVVAAGAQAAIGVQDDIDDELLELFYATFYRYWREEQGDLYGAFRAAWARLTEESADLTDGGLILWSADPLLRGSTTSPRIAAELPIWSPEEAGARRRQALEFDIKHCKELNHSQLHNGEPLFEKFLLINDSAHIKDANDVQAILMDIDVLVTLTASAESTRFKRRVSLSGASLDLRRDIHVPLISELMRSVHESISTSLEVEVSWGGPLFLDSFRVRLLPVDQWRDNDLDGKWLPSFVLPRDPAVAQLIEKAQRYVRVVRDDPTAGFDGYQSYDPKAGDSSEVDRQVQAIWSMIVHELDLGYINPPPSYSSALDSQRLRTPSMVVGGRSGTCIDLALLLAGCLEYIDVHPVLFLLKDHAFPGYWRCAEFRQEFFEVTTSMPADVGTEQKDRTEVAGAQSVPWWLRHPMAYKEILRNIEMGRLVPLESVWLTERSGFFDAIDGGRDNLKSARRWHSMLDIVRAREEGVTPLPMGAQHDPHH